MFHMVVYSNAVKVWSDI